MLKEERQQLILDILSEEQKVLSSELSQRFQVSEDTIRRDLNELDQKGLIKRVHSGALKAGPPVTNFSFRKHVSSDVKSNLAKNAIPFLRENSVIIIDGGTTNLEVVKQLPLDFKATIITNSPPTAMELENHHNIEVIMLGGILYKESMVNLGIDTMQMLASMRADTYVMGVYNIDPDLGVSVPTLTEARVKSKMAEISTEIIALVTADKLGTVSKNMVTRTEQVNYLITEKIDRKLYKKFSDKQITVIEA